MVKDEHVKTDWLCCPKCGGKTRTQIRQHTVLEDFPCSVRSANTPVWFAIATEDWKKSKRQTLRRSAIRKTGLHCVFLFARRTAGISEHYEKQWRNPL